MLGTLTLAATMGQGHHIVRKALKAPEVLQAAASRAPHGLGVAPRWDSKQKRALLMQHISRRKAADLSHHKRAFPRRVRAR